jgi:hypothetical protein
MNRLTNLWRILNLPCEGMARLASESLDRELMPLERFALRSHVLYCRACHRYLRQISLLRDLANRLRSRIESDDSPFYSGLPDDVRDRIKHNLRTHSG